MAHFIDKEASEASSSEEEDDSFSESESRTKKLKQKRSKTKKSKEDIDNDDSSEEEDEDDEDDDDVRDLINDDDEEEDEVSDDSQGARKREHDDDDDENSSLDSEDMDLIQENGVRLKRKPKKLSRIRKFGDSDSEQEPDDAKAIAREIFDYSNSEDEAVTRPTSRPVDNDLEIGSESDDISDEDDFIVDDNDQPISRPKKRGSNRHADSAMQQAQEVFGVEFDFNDFDEEEDGYGDMGDYDDDDDDDDEERPRVTRRGRSNKKSLQEVYEPSELQRSYLTPADQLIRAKDEPERFQLRSVPVTSASEEELKKEAEWIFNNAFDLPTLSIQERNNAPIAGKRPEIIKPDIEYALNCIRNELLEVPFIAAYRREYVPTLASSFDDTRDLWTIYRYDERWFRLQKSKESVAQLYRNMQAYLTTLPEDDRRRKISDSDVERVLECKNLDEVNDLRLHFKLYYSYLVDEMKQQQFAKKLEEKKQEQALKKNQDKSGEIEQEENGDEEKIDDEDENIDKEKDDQGGNVNDEEEKLNKPFRKFKISSAIDSYQKCRAVYLHNLVEKFGLSPEQFGENLRDDYQRNNVVQYTVKPLEEAANHTRASHMFPTAEGKLKAAKYMFSREISCDPLVRKTVRKFYFENAVIHVKPTASGLREIDESHPCYLMKYLRNKPIVKLCNEQFLHLLSAEKLKLVELKITIEPIDSSNRKTLSPYYESLKALYFSDFSSLVTKEWNEQREEAVRTALDKYLLPCFEKELREKLKKEAEEKVIKICSERLFSLLNVAPYTPPNNFEGFDDFELRNGTRICGFTFAPEGDAPCFAAVVDSENELLGHIRLPYINMRKRQDRMTAIEKENQAKDRSRFKQFIIDKKPHVIALAAETVQTQYICQDLSQMLMELHDHDGLPEVFIELVDNELSTVIKGLKKSTEEFPDFDKTPMLLQAISNARKLNEPLIEYAKLCTPDNDILCLRFHPMQDEIPKEDLLEALNQQFVTRTNAVGVDVNRCIDHTHTSDIVQFIAGLGPRKGAHLLRLIKKCQTGRLVSRQQLVQELGMTSKIFINCAGFIKLDTDSLIEHYPDENVCPLDSTRIHPESYLWARKIASDALDYEEGASDEITANAIEEILDHPEKLDDLDLGAFAKELDEVQNKGKKAFTLTSIRDELANRYKDYREAYKPPSHEEIFAMLTKETPHTFYIGKLLTCQVIGIPRRKPAANKLDTANPTRIDETNLWRCPFCLRSNFQDLSLVWNHFDTGDCPGFAIGLRCRLDNGLTGFIHNKNISDKEISNPEERVHVGQTIHARIIKIDTSKFSCELTCRSSDLIDQEFKLKPQRDEYYDVDAEEEAKRQLQASKKATRRPYTKRIIVHPAFMNIDYKACEKRLTSMEQGACIVRPSSQGASYLTASWKVAEGVHMHINIREENKDNPFSLGNQLFIENEIYEDLDEILARHIQPMASFARDILTYKYCIPAQEKEQERLTEILLAEKAKSPQLIPYRFCPSKICPGKFVLAYVPSRNVRFEFVSLTPNGYRYRKLYFKSLGLLIKWFKANFATTLI